MSDILSIVLHCSVVVHSYIGRPVWYHSTYQPRVPAHRPRMGPACTLRETSAAPIPTCRHHHHCSGNAHNPSTGPTELSTHSKHIRIRASKVPPTSSLAPPLDGHDFLQWSLPQFQLFRRETTSETASHTCQCAGHLLVLHPGHSSISSALSLGRTCAPESDS